MEFIKPKVNRAVITGIRINFCMFIDISYVFPCLIVNFDFKSNFIRYDLFFRNFLLNLHGRSLHGRSLMAAEAGNKWCFFLEC